MLLNLIDQRVQLFFVSMLTMNIEIKHSVASVFVYMQPKQAWSFIARNVRPTQYTRWVCSIKPYMSWNKKEPSKYRVECLVIVLLVFSVAFSFVIIKSIVCTT